MKPTLLLLAAGMGSRYGGLKQLDGLGKYAGKIDFYKVDIDQESELASVFGISSSLRHCCSIHYFFRQHILNRFLL